MLKNNIKKDIKMLCIENDKTQEELAEHIGTTGQYISRIIGKGDSILNQTFLKLADALGYDVEIKYHKKGEDEKQ